MAIRAKFFYTHRLPLWIKSFKNIIPKSADKSKQNFAEFGLILNLPFAWVENGFLRETRFLCGTTHHILICDRILSGRSSRTITYRWNRRFSIPMLRPYFFSQPISNGKGLDFASDLRYAFLIMAIRAKFFYTHRFRLWIKSFKNIISKSADKSKQNFAPNC
jgi:hypothetical protein